jgi:hypothetical protein
MSLGVDDLITEQTPDQVKASLYALAATFGLNTTAWQRLSPLRTIFTVVAYLFSGLTKLQAAINRSAFLDTAEGDWLTLVAWFMYGVTRIAATFASGTILISNAGGGLYTYSPGDLVVRNTVTNKTYTNTALVTINPLASNVSVAIRAIEAGAASTATPGQIAAFVAASPQLSISQTAAIVGVDAELDADLRQRCRDKLGSLSPAGPAAAYSFIAKTPALNGGVTVTRVLVRPALGDGTIRVVVAGPSGAISGTTGNPATDLGKLFIALNALAVPAGYTLLLSSAANKAVTLDNTTYVASSSGLLNADVSTAVATALTGYVATLPIGGIDLGAGGVVPYRAVEGVIKGASTGIIEGKLVTETDTALAATEVAVLNLPVTTVVQVAA